MGAWGCGWWCCRGVEEGSSRALRPSRLLGYGPGDPVWMLALELDLPGVISTF